MEPKPNEAEIMLEIIKDIAAGSIVTSAGKEARLAIIADLVEKYFRER